LRLPIIWDHSKLLTLQASDGGLIAYCIDEKGCVALPLPKGKPWDE
jgi:hypothetical protein